MRTLNEVEINSVSGGNPTGGLPDASTATGLSQQQQAAAVQQAASQAAAQIYAPIAMDVVSVLLPEGKVLSLVKAALGTAANVIGATSGGEGAGAGDGSSSGGGVTRKTSKGHFVDN